MSDDSRLLWGAVLVLSLLTWRSCARADDARDMAESALDEADAARQEADRVRSYLEDLEHRLETERSGYGPFRP